jgi:excisionase family DNA binding protein
MNYQAASEEDDRGAAPYSRIPNEPGSSERLAAAEPMLATAQDVAKLLKVSMRTLWRLRSAGRLPSPIKIGAAVRWRLEDLKTWIAAGCPSLPARENDSRRK